MDRIIKLVETLERPGTAEVLQYLKDSNFKDIHGGASHHKYKGGLIDHSLEVYEAMKKKTEGKGSPSDSVIVCSIFHDLGKTISQSGHYGKSVGILDRCGFELTEDERNAILNHHEVLPEDLNVLAPTNLGTYLKKSDMLSTGQYKFSTGRVKNKSLSKKIFNYLLLAWAKS